MISLSIAFYVRLSRSRVAYCLHSAIEQVVTQYDGRACLRRTAMSSGFSSSLSCGLLLVFSVQGVLHFRVHAFLLGYPFLLGDFISFLLSPTLHMDLRLSATPRGPPPMILDQCTLTPSYPDIATRTLSYLKTSCRTAAVFIDEPAHIVSDPKGSVLVV